MKIMVEHESSDRPLSNRMGHQSNGPSYDEPSFHFVHYR